MKRLSALFHLLATAAPATANWPQFRGAGGLGIGMGRPRLEFCMEKIEGTHRIGSYGVLANDWSVREMWKKPLPPNR